MSAFLNSGRLDHQELTEIRVRFRPKAVSQTMLPALPRNSWATVSTSRHAGSCNKRSTETVVVPALDIPAVLQAMSHIRNGRVGSQKKRNEKECRLRR